MSIKPLPDHVVAQIKSSAVVTSLNGVVDGLLRNSLDAHATQVNIAVDYGRGSCSVEDNGHGIPPAEFLQDGGLGKLHHTSKHLAPSACHGQYGNFLASVASLSLLTISSRHHRHASHNSLRLHNSKLLVRNTPALPEQRILVFAHGTRVTVKDLFGSMPVRVKQRAVDVEKSSNKHWDELLRVSVALLLAWPGAVAVTLRDSGGGQAVTLRTASCLGRTLDGPEDAVVRAARLFHQAGLCELTDVESWVPVSAVAPGVSVRGCVSLVPVATRRIQFIGVGVEPILDDRHGNVLFEEVNRMFSNSAFGTVEDDRDRETEERRDTLDGFPSRSSKVRKGLDRWPMFYVGVSVEDQARSFGLEEVLDERRNHLATVVGLLQAMFYSFLERHHFRPHHFQLGSEGQVGDLNRLGNSRSGTPQGGPVSGSSRAPSSNSVSPISRNNSGKSSKHAGQSRSKSAPSHKENRFTKSQSPSPFMQWSRIKAGPVRDYSSKPVSGGQTEERAGTKNGETTSDVANRGGPGAATAHGRLVGPDGSLLRRPFDDFISTESKGQAEKPLPLAAPGDANSGESNAFVWTNPITKARSLVDARTGFVLPTRQLQISESESGRNTGHSRAPSAGDKSSGAQNQWVRDLLAAWKNPVFESVGPSIPRLAEIADVLPPGDDFGCDDACNRGGHSVKLDGRVSKDALRHSEFIAQVDRKFLLVKIPSRAPSRRGGDPPCESALLVLVDQHAADERCRVEALFRNYFEAANGVWKARTSELEKPLHFDLSTQEQNLLRRFRSHFEYWGITYEVAPPEDRTSRGESSRTSRFRVLSLPPSIVERCRLEPKLVVDLVRKEVWAWADLDRSVPVPGLVGVREEEHAWVERFHGCPQGILDLVNSRACRSAIMFNDLLAEEECEALLERLADCAFPFQCAHGRPSMVPLLELGRQEPAGVSPTNPSADSSFVAAFKSWEKLRGV